MPSLFRISNLNNPVSVEFAGVVCSAMTAFVKGSSTPAHAAELLNTMVLCLDRLQDGFEDVDQAKKDDAYARAAKEFRSFAGSGAANQVMIDTDVVSWLMRVVGRLDSQEAMPNETLLRLVVGTIMRVTYGSLHQPYVLLDEGFIKHVPHLLKCPNVSTLFASIVDCHERVYVSHTLHHSSRAHQ